MGILAVSVFFRLWHLDRIPDLSADEAYYGVVSYKIIQGAPHGWLTPNGNPYNPFYFIPCILLHLLFRPSVVLLRSLAVASGLLALAVNFRFCRAAYGWKAAVASTVLLAVLPEDIAQSRIGWDPAQCLLAGCFVVYPSLRIVSAPGRSRIWLARAGAALLAAFLVHPTNIFLGPYLLSACAIRWPKRAAEIFAPRRLSLVPAAAYLLGGLGILGVWHHYRHRFQWGGDASFPLRYGDYFSGLTLFQDVPGTFFQADFPGSLWIAAQAIPVLLFALVFLFACVALRRRGQLAPPDRLVFVGWLACTLSFAAIAGRLGLSAGNERYGLCLILPATLAVCRAATLWTAAKPVARRVVCALGGVTCLILLSGFGRYYLQHGLSGAVDPRLAAWRLIRSQAPLNAPVILVTQNYWNYYPLRYISQDDAAVLVVGHLGNLGGSVALSHIRAGHVWSVEYADSEEARGVREVLKGSRMPMTVQTVSDDPGRPLLEVVHWNAAR